MFLLFLFVIFLPEGLLQNSKRVVEVRSSRTEMFLNQNFMKQNIFFVSSITSKCLPQLFGASGIFFNLLIQFIFVKIVKFVIFTFLLSKFFLLLLLFLFLLCLLHLQLFNWLIDCCLQVKSEIPQMLVGLHNIMPYWQFYLLLNLFCNIMTQQVWFLI